MLGLIANAMPMSSPVHTSAAMAGMKMGGITDWWTFFSWSGGYFPWIVLALELWGLTWYIRSTRKLAAKGHPWSKWRTLSFVIALVFVSLALQSGIPILANTSFVAHVFQHMLLMLAAPPMIAMSAPLTLYLQTCPRQSKVRMIAFLKSWFIRFVTFPPIVWAAFYGLMFVFFLTPLLGIAMMHPPLMDLFNVAFFMGGGLFWWPTVGLDATTHWKLPFAGRLGNLFLGIPFESFLGIALMNNSRPVAAMYTVADTHAGGSVLWAVTELFTLAGLFAVLGQWMKAEERAAAREDRRLDALEAEQQLAAAGAGAGLTSHASKLHAPLSFEPADAHDSVRAGRSSAGTGRSAPGLVANGSSPADSPASCDPAPGSPAKSALGTGPIPAVLATQAPAQGAVQVAAQAAAQTAVQTVAQTAANNEPPVR